MNDQTIVPLRQSKTTSRRDRANVLSTGWGEMKSHRPTVLATPETVFQFDDLPTIADHDRPEESIPPVPNQGRNSGIERERRRWIN